MRQEEELQIPSSLAPIQAKCSCDCSLTGMFRSDSCFVVSKIGGVLGSSMSEKSLLSEQAGISDNQVPAIVFTSVTAASFPLNINEYRGKKELMSWFDCIANSFS